MITNTTAPTSSPTRKVLGRVMCHCSVRMERREALGHPRGGKHGVDGEEEAQLTRSEHSFLLARRRLWRELTTNATQNSDGAKAKKSAMKWTRDVQAQHQRLESSYTTVPRSFVTFRPAFRSTVSDTTT